MFLHWGFFCILALITLSTNAFVCDHKPPPIITLGVFYYFNFFYINIVTNKGV